MPKKTPTERAEQTSDTPSYVGHRERIRMRFQRNGFAGMMDYEVLEALLTLAIPRRDVKQLSKQLLAKYRTVSEVLSQPIETLAKFPGLGKTSAINLKMFLECTQYCLQEKCLKTNLLDDSGKLREFVRMKLGVKFHESYMAIFLNSHNYLIDYKIIAEGTIDRVHTYARNILEIALHIGASKVVLVHNHPSGICLPSDDDLTSTYSCYNAMQPSGVILADHLIVSRSECFSFKDHQIDLSGPPEKKNDAN